MFTLILTLSMCALLFLMIWAATYFYPWTGLLRFFPQDIEEKARQHKPPFPAAPVIGWIIMLLCALGFIGVIVYGGWDGLQNGFTFRQFLTRFLIILFGMKAFDIIALDYVLITKTQFSSIIFRRQNLHRNLKWARQSTIGHGAACCDFRIIDISRCPDYDG